MEKTGPKIYFFEDNGEKIDFRNFLLKESGKYKSTAEFQSHLLKELDINIKGYIYETRSNQDHIYPYNSPTEDKFRKIIDFLGYKENRFEVKKLNGTSLTDMGIDDYLSKIGDAILKKEKETGEKIKFSVPIIKEFGSDGFYRMYAKGYENKKKIYNRMIQLHPKYENIDFQFQSQDQRKDTRYLEDFEKEIIQNSILYFLERNPMIGERLPYGINQHVTDKLNEELIKRNLAERTVQGVHHHIRKIWNPEKQYKRKYTSPSVSLITPSTKKLASLVNEKITDLEVALKTEAGKDISKEEIFKSKNYASNKEHFLQKAAVGHTNLLLFLSEEKNYKKYLGENLRLYYVDFPDNDYEKDLIKKYEKKIKEYNAKDSKNDISDELSGFVGGWLRCDMLFEKFGGGFTVVEIKQNAIDDAKFLNGTKACQQLAAYSAVVLDNLQRYNYLNASIEDYEPYNETVDSVLAAYQIEKQFVNHLKKASNKTPVIIDKLEVDEWIKLNT